MRANIRAAVIGVGKMGRKHLEVLESMGIRVAGICDVSSANLQSAQGVLPNNAAAIYQDPQRMLMEQMPDLVVIATTADSHCDLTCMAAKLGVRMILCEKPMARSLGECTRMIETCRVHGARLAVNHQMRFMEQYTRPKSIVSSEEFGGLASVTVVAGNFGLAMNGTHYFEMFRYMTGELACSVTAWFAPGLVPNPRGQQFEDRAGCVRIVGQGGTRFYLDAGSDQGHGFVVIYAGKYGMLVVDETTGRMRYSRREAQYRSEPTTRYLLPFRVDDLEIAPAEVLAPTRAVVLALLQGEGYPTGEDGANSVKVLIAGYYSSEMGGVTCRLDEAAFDPERQFPWA